MAKTIEWTLTAQMRYREITNYLIDNWSIAAADRFIDTIDRKLNLLTQFPELGQRTRRNSKTRQGKYHTLFYEPQRSKILVIDIKDNRQKS